MRCTQSPYDGEHLLIRPLRGTKVPPADLPQSKLLGDNK